METLARRYFVLFYKRCLDKSDSGNMSEMARESGLSPSTINRFLKDPMNPDISIPRTDTLLQVSTYSGVPIFSGMEETGYVLEEELPSSEVSKNNAQGSPDPLGKRSPQVG